MGAERWLMLKSNQEAQRLKEYLGGLDEIGVDGKYGWWLEWPGKKKFSVGYSMGAMSSDGAGLVCREIARRFDVVRIGADSVGWYDDKDWQSDAEGSATDRYGAHDSWAEWIKDFKIEHTSSYEFWHQFAGDEGVQQLREMEQFVVGQFAQLDDAAQGRG